jgi:multimeric flavodoxin WrbA
MNNANSIFFETQFKNKLQGKKTLFITTSNRWNGSKEKPKSTLLAEKLSVEIKGEVKIINIPDLNIFPCEGNISTLDGNNCGVKKSILNEKIKNPTGFHRCWASLNNQNDELWKVSKEIFESDAVIFFVSIRWGQTNSFYQKLIERLSWIENRHATLGESNIVEGKLAGMITIGQNWNGEMVLETQKEVLEFYGFTVPYELSFHWQYTPDILDETEKSYIDAPKKFSRDFDVDL